MIKEELMATKIDFVFNIKNIYFKIFSNAAILYIAFFKFQ